MGAKSILGSNGKTYRLFLKLPQKSIRMNAKCITLHVIFFISKALQLHKTIFPKRGRTIIYCNKWSPPKSVWGNRSREVEVWSCILTASPSNIGRFIRCVFNVSLFYGDTLIRAYICLLEMIPLFLLVWIRRFIYNKAVIFFIALYCWFSKK